MEAKWGRSSTSHDAGAVWAGYLGLVVDIAICSVRADRQGRATPEGGEAFERESATRPRLLRGTPRRSPGPVSDWWEPDAVGEPHRLGVRFV